MRIISTSDLQLDKEGSKRRIAKIKPMLNLEADVLIYLGDLSDNKTNFQKGLEILAKTKATSRFYVIGNRDLLSLEDSALTDHCDEIQERLLPFGFHLLDKKPKIVNGVGFVGNCAWYDGSLFKVPINPFSNESYPDNLVEALRYVETHFLSAGYNIPAKLRSE